jgi:hypothetical protein
MNARRLFPGLCLTFLSLAVASPVLALANRVFVSARSGNDANACASILTPCQTFAGAVLQLNPGGDAIVLDSGGYGPVTITQALTIEAPAGVTAFIHPASGDGITVNAGGSDVVILRGLVLNGGPGYGIIVNTVGTLHIENCVISGFASYGINYLANGSLFVKDTIVRQNFEGLVVQNGRASIDHCRFEGNAVDGALSDGADITIRDSVAAGNGRAGFYASSIGSENTVMNVYECVSTNNLKDGLYSLNTGTGFVIARVANSSISENVRYGLVVNPSVTFESLGNNFVRGNVTGNLFGSPTIVAGQ